MKQKTIVRNSFSKRNFDKFKSNKLAVSGLAIVIIILLAVLFAPLLTKYDPITLDMSNKFAPPSSEHILGTDSIGRDLFARLLYGGRYSIFIGLTGALGSTVIGVILGGVSGYFGGKVDAIILYFSEIFMSFPQLLLILILVGFAGQGMKNIIIIFTITGWTHIQRIMRSKVLSLREEAFVESCKANGIGGMSIMFRHMLPNTLGPVIVSFSLETAGIILAEAALSYIGLGVEPSIPTWGTIMNAAKGLSIMQDHPLLWIAPGVAIALFVIGVNFFGDGLRDVYDPGQ